MYGHVVKYTYRGGGYGHEHLGSGNNVTQLTPQVTIGCTRYCQHTQTAYVLTTTIYITRMLGSPTRIIAQNSIRQHLTNELTLWLMEPGRSMPHSQGLSNNPNPEANQPQFPALIPIYSRSILILSSHLRLGLPKRRFAIGLPVKLLKALLPSSSLL